MHIQQFLPIAPCFSSKRCDQIQRLCDDVVTDSAKVISKKGSEKRSMIRRCNSGWLHMGQKTGWLFEEIWNLVSEANAKTFNFHIATMESLQYLEYGPLNWFHWHVDNGDDNVGNRKLTAIIQLSDPSDYVGGNLQIKAQAPACQPPRSRGAVTIFPSHLLHRATPVWWGSRKVLVAWIRGTTTLR